MSIHKLIKVRQNEAAILFKSDGKIETIHCDTRLNEKCAPAFAMCYAISVHEYLYNKFCDLIVTEMRQKIIGSKSDAEVKQYEAFIDMIQGA